jgi:hypothetical protein
MTGVGTFQDHGAGEKKALKSDDSNYNINSIARRRGSGPMML